MPRQYDREYSLIEIGVPERLQGLVDTPRLLLGERREDFCLFFESMVNELCPGADLDWLLAIDLAWIYWEIQRYRRWKNSIIAMKQRAALEEALAQTDPDCPFYGPVPMLRAEVHIAVKALEGDASRDPALATQLAQHGYDDESLNATAFMLAAAPLAVIEKFLATARLQLTTTLREAIVRQEFKLRAEQLERRLMDEDRKNEASQREKGNGAPPTSSK